MSDYGVVVYHCSRLLNAEVSDIRQHGLRVASADLLDRKLMSAVEPGHLSGEHAAHLRATSILADKNQDGIRTNRVSALSIRRTIDLEARDGLWRFFEVWGGEITYWTHQDDAEWSMLRLVGRPAIVVLDLPISLGKLWAPELANLVVGRWRGLVDCASEVHVNLSPGQRCPSETCGNRATLSTTGNEAATTLGACCLRGPAAVRRNG